MGGGGGGYIEVWEVFMGGHGASEGVKMAADKGT